MNKFEKIYQDAIKNAIEKGDRIGLTDYEKKLVAEALEEGASEAHIHELRKHTREVWHSDGLSLLEIYGIIAGMYEGISKRRAES